VFGGRGVNYTKARVIEESTLIEVYQNCHSNMEHNFKLASLTVQHAPADMTKTFSALATYMQEHGPNEIRPGRTTCHAIPVMINEGLGCIAIGEATGGPAQVDEDIGSRPTAEDLAVIE